MTTTDILGTSVTIGAGESNVYSHSRLTTFEQCPLKYRYRYVDRIVSDVDTIEAYMGRCVHESLDELYSSVRDGNVFSEEELLERHQHRWRGGWHEKILIVKANYCERDYLLKSVQALRRFYLSYHPFDGTEVVATELEVVFPLDAEGRHVMRGFVDRLDKRADGVYEIHDYKTSGTLPTVYKLKKDRQLPLYHLAIKCLFEDAREVELFWHYLMFGKRFRTTKTAVDLDLVKRECLETIGKIEAAIDFPATETKLCNWCEYAGTCEK